MVGLMQFSRAKAAVAVDSSGFMTEKPQIQVKILAFQTPLRETLSGAPSGQVFVQLCLCSLGTSSPAIPR